MPRSTHRTYQCRPLGDGRCGNTIAGWNRAIKDDIGDHAHGTIDMERAIAVSCNAYFAQLGVHDVGSKALAETAERLGLSTGDPAELRQALPFAAYGQGPVLVTPFKMARVAATIAAGGRMPQGRWIAGDGNPRQDAPLEVLPRAQAAFLAGAMRRVVTEGTARHVMAGAAVEMAGKTGTAQLDQGMPHAWFTGFAPFEGAAGTAAGLRGDRGTRRLRRARRGADRARSDGGGQRVGIAMNLTEFLEKWGRTVFESPLARTASLESPPELAEIRFAVLDEVRRNSYRAGARQVFPFDLVRVTMRGVEESRAHVFRSGFFRQYLEHEIQGSLRADHVRFPEQLRVEVDVATGLPLPNEPWLTVAAASQEQPGGVGESGPAGGAPGQLECAGTADREAAGAYRARSGRVSQRRHAPPQRPGVCRGQRGQPLRLARACAHRLRRHDGRVPPVQRPLVRARAPIAARESCAME